ncbi:S9 family peptidase [Candidatus Bathyarchaeota archaeon]|nr:S9 family peptidase [Candidatus Bathyarchaeota archaeon]
MSQQGVGTQFPIQSLLSARLLLSPQLAKGKVYFLSDMSGVISLYAMDQKGSIPEPLLPAGLALQNPHLMAGHNYYVLPKLGKILVMIDENGNENYQPCFIPLDGGIPEPIFGDKYKNEQLACINCDTEKNIAYFFRDDRKTPNIEGLRVDLNTLEVTSLGKSLYGNTWNGVNKDHTIVILADSYTAGDTVLYIWRNGTTERRLLYGIPIEKRIKNQQIQLSGFGTCNFTPEEKGLLIRTNLFSDEGSIGYFALDNPANITEVPILGLKHKGHGELVDLKTVHDDLYLLEYNIDVCSWLYECQYHENKSQRRLEVIQILCGLPPLDEGVILGYEFELHKTPSQTEVGYTLSHSKANSPAQICVYPTSSRTRKPKILSHEHVLGINQKFLSPGEDASYTSSDGLRISARLYLPSEEMGFKGSRPLVLYVHGGPQSQERPDFSWFSMPLIQFLTLNGFAVFVPNVRGSVGYGMKYMKQVDHDWGGKDRFDHIEGLKMLEKDTRIDSSRRAVIGRSYGGFMTLTLASRHPDLWKAACDMFGPYDLISFIHRLPKTWQTFFIMSMGHPEKDKEFLKERSPKTYLKNIKCPMLIIQGKNDPRVLIAESKDVAEDLKANGVETELLVFEDEGHDVIKFKNKVPCYTKIIDFFKKHLKP